MYYERQFIVGNIYLTKAGTKIQIMEESVFRSPYYTSVKGNDGIWRWDRYQNPGERANGSDMNDLVVGSKQ